MQLPGRICEHICCFLVLVFAELWLQLLHLQSGAVRAVWDYLLGIQSLGLGVVGRHV